MVLLQNFREPFIYIKEWGWSTDQHEDGDPVWIVLPKTFKACKELKYYKCVQTQPVITCSKLTVEELMACFWCPYC